MSSEQILEDFYNEYFRAPQINEFEGWGGDIDEVKKKYKSYKRFLQDFGLTLQSKAETYEVVHIRTGEVKFTGTMAEIAFEYDTTRQTVIRAYNNGIFKKIYKIVHKPYEPRVVVKRNISKEIDQAKKKKVEAAVEEARECLDTYKSALKDFIRYSWIDNDGGFNYDSKYSIEKIQGLENECKDAINKINELKRG